MARRAVALLVAVLVVFSGVPAFAGGEAPPVESVEEPPDSDDRVGNPDPVVVPVVGDPVVADEEPRRLPALPDPDVGRDGFAFGSASATVGSGGGVVGLGDLPVVVEVAAGDSDLLRVDVEVLDPGWATLISPEVGLAVQVDLSERDAASVRGSRSAEVTLDYSGVPLGYGAGLFERLAVFWVDDCVALVSGVVSCGTRVEVPAEIHTRDRTLSFWVTDTDLREVEEADQAQGAAMPVGSLSGAPRWFYWGGFGPPPGGWFVVGSTPDGPQGSFSAAPQSVVADYQVSLSTGHFQMSYPIRVPPSFQGPQPSVVLSYDSGSVDGLTMDRNTQASVVGLGWSYHPGSITRMLAPCSGVSGGSPGSGDLCPTPDEEIFTLNLNGVGSRLIEVDAVNRVFRLEGERFWELQLKSGASNGDSEGEWWELRTPDGYTYRFGREQTSSYNSAQYVQVWVPSGGNPGGWCGGGGAKYCDKAYQWNLERVIDPDGFVMEVFYIEETNEYDPDDSPNNVGDTLYVRSALPDYIVYGDGPGTDHHAQVDFVYDHRCVDYDLEDEVECGDGLDAQMFPDTPVDLDCSSGNCEQATPSFWTSQRLAEINTYVYDFATPQWVLLDQWRLTHDFPTIPDDPDGDQGLTKLWLTEIKRYAVSEWVGDATSSHQPATKFDFVLLPNRMTYLDFQWPSDAPMYLPRISEIDNELRGITAIEYGRSHDCYDQGDSYDPLVDDWPFGSDTANDVGDPGSNRRRPCDEFLARDPTQTSKWVPMRKWKVLRVTEEGDWGNPDVVTTYDYRLDDAQGNPTEAPKWKWQEHPYLGVSESVWDDYRGHRRVRVIDSTGAYTTYTFYAGVAGDHEPTTWPYLVDTFTTTDNTTHTDHDYLAGQVAEVHSYTSAGTELTRTLTEYYGAETFTGKGTFYTRPAEVTETVFGSPSVTASSEYTYDDDHGNPIQVLYNGTAGDSPVVEETDWIQSASYPLMWRPNQGKLWDGSSPGTGGDEAAMVRYFYDGATSYTTGPTLGRLTKTKYYTQRTPSNDYVEYLIGYDTSGRPVTYTDPLGVETGFGYDSDYGFVDSKTLNAGGAAGEPLTTAYTVHPGRGAVLTATDPNSQVVEYAYDELGRLVEYWNAARSKTDSGSVLYSYTNPSAGVSPALVRERPLVGGNRLDSYAYFDGFGRTIQTQTPFDQDGDAVADDRAITSTRYDTRGLVRYQTAPYANTAGGAGSGYVTPAFGSIDTYTETSYDALGRVVKVAAMSDGSELFATTTAYGSITNRTWVETTDPEGRWFRHYSDGFGRLTRVLEPGGHDTYYTYTPRGELETVTDDKGNVTSIEYDLLGRKKQMTDPDMGAWSYGYDDNSRITTQTDGRGTTLTILYDDLGRIIQRKQGSTILADYTYGTNTATANRAGRLIKTRINNNDTDAAVTINSYNPDGLVLSQTNRIAGIDYYVDYTYFNGGAISTIQYPGISGNRETVTYSYDGLGHPFDLIGGQTYVDDASWTVAGQPNLWTVGPASGGTTRRWDYDPQTLRVDEYKAGSTQYTGTNKTQNLMRLEYSYDDSGNITWIKDYKNSSQRECFTYDTRNRLTAGFTGNSTCSAYSSTGSNPYDETYTYNSIHNITNFDGTTYTYGTGNASGSGDAGPHAVVTAGSIGFGYDDNGNRVTKTASGSTTTYTYNADNRLTAVNPPSDPDDITFLYDADGNRVKRTHGTYSTTYIAGLMEIDKTGTTVTQRRTLYSFAGTPVAVRTHTNPETTFVFDNHLGSISTAWNDTTNTVTRQRYYPWGKDRGSTGTLPSDHRYTGQISDATAAPSGGTGLLYYNARYYDPTIGAFVAADTVVGNPGYPADLNRYAYVRDNPVNFNDPTGHGLLFPLIIGDSNSVGRGKVVVAGETIQLMSINPYIPGSFEDPQAQFWEMYNAMYRPKANPDWSEVILGTLNPFDGCLIYVNPGGSCAGGEAWKELKENPADLLQVAALITCLSGVAPMTCFLASEAAVGAAAIDFWEETGDASGALQIAIVGSFLNFVGFKAGESVNPALSGLFDAGTSQLTPAGLELLTLINTAVQSWLFGMLPKAP